MTEFSKLKPGDFFIPLRRKYEVFMKIVHFEDEYRDYDAIDTYGNTYDASDFENDNVYIVYPKFSETP